FPCLTSAICFDTETMSPIMEVLVKGDMRIQPTVHSIIPRRQRAALRCIPLVCLVVTFTFYSGCDKNDSAPGTPENLKADYERVVRERDQLKVDCDTQKQDIEKTWRQRIADKEQKAAELTADNASLRQRLLTVESALNEVPLVDSARNRSVMWL